LGKLELCFVFFAEVGWFSFYWVKIGEWDLPRRIYVNPMLIQGNSKSF